MNLRGEELKTAAGRFALHYSKLLVFFFQWDTNTRRLNRLQPKEIDSWTLFVLVLVRMSDLHTQCEQKFTNILWNSFGERGAQTEAGVSGGWRMVPDETSISPGISWTSPMEEKLRAGEGWRTTNTHAAVIQPLGFFVRVHNLAAALAPEPVAMTTVGFCSNHGRY